MKKQIFIITFVFLSLFLTYLYQPANQNNTHKGFQETPISSWQTYCAIPSQSHFWNETDLQYEVQYIGRASEDIRSGHLFIAPDGLRVWDVANKEQFILDGKKFKNTSMLNCPAFEAYDYQFTHHEGYLKACLKTNCTSIDIMPNTIPFTYAASNGGVFVGTSQGDTLLFRDGKWCRMIRDGDQYYCPDKEVPIVTEPSNQFYSSTIYYGITLIGEYPTGSLFEFDGTRVKPSHIQPPSIDGGTESQTLAFYCGDLFVGYWPHGEVYRYDGDRWYGPISFFSGKKSSHPYSEAAKKEDLIINFFGKRVPSLVPYQDSLYVITANKGDWNNRIQPDIPAEVQQEYGAVYRIYRDGCYSAPAR